MTTADREIFMEPEEELDRQSRLLAQRMVLQLERRCVADPSGKIPFDEVLQLAPLRRRAQDNDDGHFVETLMEVLEESGFPCRRQRGDWVVRGLRFARA